MNGNEMATAAAAAPGMDRGSRLVARRETLELSIAF